MKRKFRSPLVVTLGSLTVVLSLSSCASQSEPRPAVAAFLKKHPELGTATQVQDAKDWKKEQRQRILSSTGRRLVFHLQNDEVQKVYDESRSKPVLVWPDSIPATTSSQTEATPASR